MPLAKRLEARTKDQISKVYVANRLPKCMDLHKKEMIKRLLDYNSFGVLGRCPTCGPTTLRWKLVRRAPVAFCPGLFDRISKSMQKYKGPDPAALRPPDAFTWGGNVRLGPTNPRKHRSILQQLTDVRKLVVPVVPLSSTSPSRGECVQPIGQRWSRSLRLSGRSDIAAVGSLSSDVVLSDAGPAVRAAVYRIPTSSCGHVDVYC